MDKRRIENYKKMADDSAAIIYDEKVKLFEYEQMWSAKKQERQNMFFVKRFFDKETKANLSSIQDYINISNGVITQTKTSWENEKKEFIKNCIDDYINADSTRVAEYYRLQNQLKLKKSIFEIVDTTEKSGRSAVEWLFSTVKDINDILSSESLTSRYDHIFLPEISSKLSRTLGIVESFKRNVNYGAIQIKTVNELEDTAIWENASKVLKDDKSQSIVIKDSRRQLRANIAEVNTTLAVIRVAHNILNNERNRLVDPYNIANRSFTAFWNDILSIVKSKLEEEYNVTV
jgi:hypothetical protein